MDSLEYKAKIFSLPFYCTKPNAFGPFVLRAFHSLRLSLPFPELFAFLFSCSFFFPPFLFYKFFYSVTSSPTSSFSLFLFFLLVLFFEKKHLVPGDVPPNVCFRNISFFAKKAVLVPPKVAFITSVLLAQTTLRGCYRFCSFLGFKASY